MKHEDASIILQALLDGVNPITGEVLPPDHVCMEIDVIRALHTALMTLHDPVSLDAPPKGIYRKNGKLNAGRPWTAQDDERLIKLHQEERSMEEICAILQRRERGVTRRLEELRHQQQDIEPMQKDNRGKPWLTEDEAWLVQAWKEGRSISEMAEALARTPYAIRMRLEKQGLYEGGMTKEDEPPRWTEQDSRELARMFQRGSTLTEMAEYFHRTEKAIEVRLFYMGLSKNPPKLF